ncbi:MAG: MFS transporter [Candidatus Omnitrophica bacterium]|nr:MFS transporter [Candidatus Omnitrophota bacterium]
MSDQKNVIELKFIFRALRHRNYRIFFIGQGTSLIGTWMQQVAMSWLVYRITNSPFMLGLIGFVGLLPSFLFMPLAGVIADRYNRRRILMVTQSLALFQSAVLALLVITGKISVWHIMVLSMFLGLVFSFDMPIRQAFTVDLIDDREDLGNAIALNSSMFNIARLIGPSVAGILIAVCGEGICFFINALSYIPVIAALGAITLTPRLVVPSANHVLGDIKQGFIYAYNFVPIRAILLLLGLVSLMGVPYQVLMPVFAKDIFHGGPQTLGFLMAMFGVGAIGGAIYLAGRKSIVGLGKEIAVASVFFGLCLVAVALSRTLWITLILVSAAGFAMMVQMAASNTILQTVVDEDKRGRVMSLYTLSFMGTAPFGSLLAGWLAHNVGAPNALLFGGVCCVMGAAVFFKMLPVIRKSIHPVYVQKGIIHEVAEGINAASEMENLSKE